jgi:hypothetical protein
VNGLYSQSLEEHQHFAEGNEARHSVINSPRGTGTPAHGLGFGGHKRSGEGAILSPDPLRPFTVHSKVPEAEIAETPHLTDSGVEKWVLRKNNRAREGVVVRFTEVPCN